MNNLTEKLEKQFLERDEFKWLLENNTPELRADLSNRAQRVSGETFGKGVYVRGLIEFSNYCKNDCYYCGIRRGNEAAHRYRLSEQEILDCCALGYDLGFRTFVLQGR